MQQRGSGGGRRGAEERTAGTGQHVQVWPCAPTAYLQQATIWLGHTRLFKSGGSQHSCHATITRPAGQPALATNTTDSHMAHQDAQHVRPDVLAHEQVQGHKGKGQVPALQLHNAKQRDLRAARETRVGQGGGGWAGFRERHERADERADAQGRQAHRALRSIAVCHTHRRGCKLLGPEVDEDEDEGGAVEGGHKHGGQEARQQPGEQVKALAGGRGCEAGQGGYESLVRRWGATARTAQH